MKVTSDHLMALALSKFPDASVAQRPLVAPEEKDVAPLLLNKKKPPVYWVATHWIEFTVKSMVREDLHDHRLV